MICSIKLKDQITILNIIHQFGSKEDKSDYVILTNYFDSLERIAFNGKLKDYLFNKINSIVITNESEIFKQIQQQLADIKSEFTTESIHKLLNDLAINDNTYLNIYSESVDYTDVEGSAYCLNMMKSVGYSEENALEQRKIGVFYRDDMKIKIIDKAEELRLAE